LRVDPGSGAVYSIGRSAARGLSFRAATHWNSKLRRAQSIRGGITKTDPTDPEFEDEAGTMANTKSAKKAARQAVRRTEVNKSRTTRARSAVRDVEEAIKAGNKSAAKDALKSAQPVLASTAQKGVIDRKAASRKVSRLSARVKAMAD
jgi:small subunit ribosomal protein S20